MKKLKNYILMLLVPLILLGCVSKGVSDAVEDTTDSYSFTKLQAMIDGSQLTESSLNNNLNELVSLKSKVSGDTNAVTDINTLANYLTYNVQIPILNSTSSFVYSTAVTKSQGYDNEIVGDLGLYTYDELIIIKKELESLNSTDTIVLMLISKLDLTINAIKNRRAINPFYSIAYLLYTQYINYIGNTTYKYYLSNTIGINIDEILTQSGNIDDAYKIILTEISNLSSNAYTFAEKTTIQGFLNQVKTTYYNYLYNGGNYNDIDDARAVLRVQEKTIAASSTLITYYSGRIDAIYKHLKDLKGLDSTDAALVTDIIAHIDAYYARNIQFNNKNYVIIHSKIANIVEEYKYLKSKETYISVTLKFDGF